MIDSTEMRQFMFISKKVLSQTTFSDGGVPGVDISTPENKCIFRPENGF